MPILGIWYPEINETRVTEKFNITNNDPHYAEFKKNTIIKGVYDDHDSNENNGGKFNPLKESAKQLYLDFLNEPNDSPLRQQDGIYHSFYVDEYNKILVVMTDTRYNSDKYTGDNLGDNQWVWLEKQFQKESELIIMTSGVQVLHDDRQGPETWFKESKEKLYNLISKYNRPIVFLSGDVHYSEILHHPCPQNLGQNVYEFTSSGLTFANYDHIPFVETIFKFLFPSTFSSFNDHYYKSNFGILKIETDNNHSPIKVIFEAHSSKDSSVALKKEINIVELQKQNFEPENCILDQDPDQRFWQNIKERVIENQILVGVVGFVALMLLLTWLNYIWLCIMEGQRLFKQIKGQK